MLRQELSNFSLASGNSLRYSKTLTDILRQILASSELGFCFTVAYMAVNSYQVLIFFKKEIGFISLSNGFYVPVALPQNCSRGFFQQSEGCPFF